MSARPQLPPLLFFFVLLVVLVVLLLLLHLRIPRIPVDSDVAYALLGSQPSSEAFLRSLPELSEHDTLSRLVCPVTCAESYRCHSKDINEYLCPA